MVVLLVMIVVFIAAVGWRVYRAWKRNAYRRAGVDLLRDAGTAYDVSVILKRVALAAFPREDVAALWGDEWYAFLMQMCPGSDLSGAVESQTDGGNLEALKEFARTWILTHKTCF
jgi:hypothetical protein